MATRGDVQTATFFTISAESPLATGPTFAEGIGGECCVDLLLFGDNSTPENTANKYRNDKTGYFEYYSNDTDSAVMKIQKCVNGTMTDQHTVDGTYGTFSDFGEFQSDNRKYISLKNIDWTAILLAFGEGKYRLIVETTNILASVVTVPDCSFTYTLKNYSDEAADGTVFIRTNPTNILGNIKRPDEAFTFPSEWSNGIRVPAWFGSNFSEYERETVRYDIDGFLQDLTNDQTEKFILDTDGLPAYVHNFLKTNMFQSNYVNITDYNTDNANRHTETRVKLDSEYSPNWIKRVNKATVSVEFKSAFDNLRALNC